MKLKTFIKWNSESIVCPQALVGDFFQGCSFHCSYCFCRELEMKFKKINFLKKDISQIIEADEVEMERIFDKARSSDFSKNWIINCIRRNFPYLIGWKSDPFPSDDVQICKFIEKYLNLIYKYQIPVIFHTKSTYIRNFIDIIKELNKKAVIITIFTVNKEISKKLEPNCPSVEERFELVKYLNSMGIPTNVKYEPIMGGINDNEEDFEEFFNLCKLYKVPHVSFYHYRSSYPEIAWENFEKQGFDYKKIILKNQDKEWRKIAISFYQKSIKYEVPSTSADFVNMGIYAQKESCCGMDGIFDDFYHFTFQNAVKIAKEKGCVSWEDMENIEFKNEVDYQKMKKIWNGNSQFFSLMDSPYFYVIDKKNGMNIYKIKTYENKLF